MSVLEDVLNDVEVGVALLVEVKALEDVNVDVGVVVLLEDAKKVGIAVLVLLRIVKADVEVALDAV